VRSSRLACLLRIRTTDSPKRRFEPTKPTATKKKTAAATKKTPAGPAARRKNAVDKSKAARAAKVSTNRMDTSADDANGKKVRRRGAAKS